MGFRDCGALETSPLEPPGEVKVYSLPLQRARKYEHTLKGRLNALQVPGNNFMPLILMAWETTINVQATQMADSCVSLPRSLTRSSLYFSSCYIISMM